MGGNMGSIISLGIKKMEIDWGKNNVFNNHSKLYRLEETDIDIPYYDVDDYDKEIIKYEKGAVAKLSYIKERLELLGYSLKEVESEYNEAIKEYEFYMDETITLSFKDFYTFITSLDVTKVDNVFSTIEDYSDDGYDSGEYFRKCICNDIEISKKLTTVFKKIKKQYYIIGEFFENINPYIILRLIAENPRNLGYNIEWRYNEVLENGWVKKDDIIPKLEDSDKILIVTEGKTDSFIIKKVLKELYPNISDFFEFIDMKENYPFTGVGNLSNFCLGLAKINIQNKIIVIFDNDTAGLELYNKVKDINKPKNMCICHLPNSDDFSHFKTIGPSGSRNVNINGKAVAIECFLDFQSVPFLPRVRWNNYNKNMKQYQGELENKEEYCKSFAKADLTNGTYNCTKLVYLINYLLDIWKKR